MAKVFKNKNIILVPLVILLILSNLVETIKLVHVENSAIENIEPNSANSFNNNSHKDDKNDNQSGDEQMPVNDQISLLSKRLEILTEHRQEDYRMLERSLYSYVQKNLHEYINVDIKKELKDLRNEIKILRQGQILPTNKEKLTTWLTSSISELRSEISELQESASNLSKSCSQNNQVLTDIQRIHDEIKNLRLEVNSVKSRQDKSEIMLRELREELTESFEVRNKKIESSSGDVVIRSEAEHKLRHYRLLRAQVQEMESAQRLLERRLIEIENEKILEKLQNIENKQKSIENTNFNLSHEIRNFEVSNKKSFLELLDDIAEMETKIDHTIPEIRQEITKTEIDSAQLKSNQNILKEEEHNLAKTIQALAVSVNTLQNERLKQPIINMELNRIKMDIKKLKASIDEKKYNQKKNTHQTMRSTGKEYKIKIGTTPKLLMELESVEKQYHNIIEALPSGCHEVEPSDNDLHMIAPVYHPHPTLVKCIGPWTVIQRRVDGSVDFNRSWEEYSKGFGDPNSELWIGNEVLHHLTKDNCTKLRIIIQDIENKTLYADYDSFYIATRSEGYRIDLAGYSGNASNALDYQNHMKFSSIDVDLDISHDHCAGEYEGGWWFSYCSHGNLNGRYNSGVTWYDLSNNEWMAVKSTLMMITKRQECLNQSNEEGYLSSTDISDSETQSI